MRGMNVQWLVVDWLVGSLAGWLARLLAGRLLQMAAMMGNGVWSHIIDDGDDGDVYNGDGGGDENVCAGSGGGGDGDEDDYNE